jgi:hypothetical protein
LQFSATRKPEARATLTQQWRRAPLLLSENLLRITGLIISGRVRR